MSGISCKRCGNMHIQQLSRTDNTTQTRYRKHTRMKTREPSRLTQQTVIEPFDDLKDFRILINNNIQNAYFLLNIQWQIYSMTKCTHNVHFLRLKENAGD